MVFGVQSSEDHLPEFTQKVKRTRIFIYLMDKASINNAISVKKEDIAPWGLNPKKPRIFGGQGSLDPFYQTKNIIP
jgi:hypothetical protein